MRYSLLTFAESVSHLFYKVELNVSVFIINSRHHSRYKNIYSYVNVIFIIPFLDDSKNPVPVRRMKTYTVAAIYHRIKKPAETNLQPCSSLPDSDKLTRLSERPNRKSSNQLMDARSKKCPHRNLRITAQELFLPFRLP